VTGISEIPESDRALYQCIGMNRANLSTFADNFQRSVSLFELLERGGGPPSTGVFGGVFIFYRIIAARDGALNLFHFRCSLEAFRRQTEAIRRNIGIPDRDDIRTLLVELDRKLPHIDVIRNAIAHAGELHDTPKKISSAIQKKRRVAHGIETGVGGIFKEGLFEKTYSIGKNGKIFSLEITKETASILTEVVHLANQISVTRV
jgi:hypothetical protein